MQEQDVLYFQQLKKEVEKVFKERQPACDRSIHEWKGQDILNFQEDLQTQVKGRISEKWFYTHMRERENKRLPRIDMLNLLSEYAGYKSWQEFNYQHKGLALSDSSLTLGNKKWLLPLIGIFLAICGLSIWAFSGPEKTYSFCFKDGTTGESIIDPLLEVVLLEEGQSPRKLNCDKKGCLKVKAAARELRFVVSAPYYHSDTILRELEGSNGSEDIDLRSDDYAMMIHYFSSNKEEDWKKRRDILAEIFAEHARVFQVSPNNALGMELFNKEEFINKLTTPIQSLGQIEVLETQYDKGKIVSMRFIQKENRDE
ncbi:MAG: hypothetical protein R8P61_18400 [Bacteroidia bacterium]|nr:hypothetical protein [Bacteroidia bacterium]